METRSEWLTSQAIAGATRTTPSNSKSTSTPASLAFTSSRRYTAYSLITTAMKAARSMGTSASEKKRLQTIVPDLVTANHPEGSVLQTPGPQMHEIKRIQSILSFNRITGISTGQNDLYKARLRSSFVRATDRRVNKIPAEYKAKARAADARFGGGGRGQILNALNAMPEAKGIALVRSVNSATP